MRSIDPIARGLGAGANVAINGQWARGGGPILGFVGDSRFANSILSSGVSSGRTMQAAASWIEFLTYGRVRCPMSYNKAVGGTGTSDLAGQITNVVAVTPRATHVAILTGTNTINNAASATGLMTTMQAYFRAAWAQLKAAGITPITVLDLPRQWTDTTLTAAVKRRLHNELNNWLRQAAPLYGSMLIDPVWVLTDPANANGECLTSYYYAEATKIHPGPTGSYQIGLLFKTMFEENGLPPRYVGFGKGDIYDATNNLHGNIISEGGICASTGGTVSGANPPTGDVPLGWILRNDTGSADLTSCVGSLEARTDGPGNWFKVVATSTGPVTVLIYNQGALNCAIGDTVQFGIDVLMDASSDLQQCDVSIKDIAGGGSVNAGKYAMQFGTLATIGAMQGTWAGRAITDPITMGASFATLRWGVSIQLDGVGGGFTVRLGAAFLRKTFSTL